MVEFRVCQARAGHFREEAGRPVVVVPSGDQHVGCQGVVDLSVFRDHRQLSSQILRIFEPIVHELESLQCDKPEQKTQNQTDQGECHLPVLSVFVLDLVAVQEFLLFVQLDRELLLICESIVVESIASLSDHG